MEKHHPILSTLIFVLVFIFLYHILEIFDVGPYSMHKWRQSDSASIALAYYHNGMHFFEPKVMNVLGGEGAAVGEFPLYYYLAAAMYQVFGVHDGIIRLLHFLTFVFGLFLFLKIVNKEVGVFATYALSIFLASLGLFGFYGFNFISDVPAFGWIFLAAFAVYKAEQQQKIGWYWLGMGAVTLAGLLKPTILIPYVAWWGVWLFSILFFKKEAKNSFIPGTAMVIGLVVVLLVNGAWVIWSRHYNEIHESGIFLSKVMPIWEVSALEKKYTWEILWYDHLLRIVRRPAFWMMVVFLLGSIVGWKAFSIRWRLFSSFVFLGTVAYFFLFFKQLRIHDYYLIECIWLFVVLLINGIVLIKKYTRKIPRSVLLFTVLFILAANLNMSYYYIKGLYSASSVYHSEIPSCMLQMDSTRNFIKKTGLTYKDNLVGIHPDPSPNIGLYNLNLKGFNLAPDFKPKFIPQLKDLGVDHFISSDTAFIRQAQAEGFLSDPVAAFEECLFVFGL